MTRINLVPPEELMDQHLFAEFREIKMIPKALRRSLKSRTVEQILARVPSEFTLNTGHVMFFYNKGSYLRQRYELLKDELRRRRVNFNEASELDPDGVFNDSRLNGDYVPTVAAYKIIRTRIAEKIAMKPSWYRKTAHFG